MTRDRNATHALLHEVKEKATAARLKRRPPVLEPIQTSNMDNTVLEVKEAVGGGPAQGGASRAGWGVQALAEMGVVGSVGYYQLLSQRWKSRPGVAAPRTLVITESKARVGPPQHTLPYVPPRPPPMA